MGNDNDTIYVPKSAHWFAGSINRWCDLAEKIYTTKDPNTVTVADVKQALERLIRAETLEASLEVNGPRQPLYERIMSIRSKLMNRLAVLEFHERAVREAARHPVPKFGIDDREMFVRDLDEMIDTLQTCSEKLENIPLANLPKFEEIAVELDDLGQSIAALAQDIREEVGYVSKPSE
jgi:hypothetical protein